MTPREFATLYGVPQPSRVTVPGSGSVNIPGDYDRYLLWFWNTSGTVFITPAENSGISFDPWHMDEFAEGIKLSHAIDGGAPCMGWTITNGGPAEQTVTIIEGFMKPPEPPRYLPAASGRVGVRRKVG